MQLEWMRQNGYVEQKEEPVKYADAEEATKAAKARHARFFGRKKKVSSNGR